MNLRNSEHTMKQIEITNSFKAPMNLRNSEPTPLYPLVKPRKNPPCSTVFGP